jgi:hypothetical protein
MVRVPASAGLIAHAENVRCLLLKGLAIVGPLCAILRCRQQAETDPGQNGCIQTSGGTALRRSMRAMVSPACTARRPHLEQQRGQAFLVRRPGGRRVGGGPGGLHAAGWRTQTARASLNAGCTPVGWCDPDGPACPPDSNQGQAGILRSLQNHRGLFPNNNQQPTAALRHRCPRPPPAVFRCRFRRRRRRGWAPPPTGPRGSRRGGGAAHSAAGCSEPRPPAQRRSTSRLRAAARAAGNLAHQFPSIGGSGTAVMKWKCERAAAAAGRGTAETAGGLCSASGGLACRAQPASEGRRAGGSGGRVAHWVGQQGGVVQAQHAGGQSGVPVRHGGMVACPVAGQVCRGREDREVRVCVCVGGGGGGVQGGGKKGRGVKARTVRARRQPRKERKAGKSSSPCRSCSPASFLQFAPQLLRQQAPDFLVPPPPLCFASAHRSG